MTDLLYISETGPAGGTPLVLLHGFPLDCRIWADVVPLLGGRVVVVDLPGFGRSAGVTASKIADFSRILFETLRAHGLLPCMLCGLSMGGYVAQDFARNYRSSVRGLVLVDTKSAADDQGGRAGRDAMIKLVRSGGAVAVADQMLPKVLGHNSLDTRPAVVRRVEDIMRSQSPAGIESALIAMRDRPDYTEDLSRIEVPVLIVVGEEDVIAPASIATGMASAVAGSKLSVIGGSGHFPPIETPEAFTATLNSWRDSLFFRGAESETQMNADEKEHPF